MTTSANVKREEGSHWYYPDGKSCYELPKKDGKGMKSPTLADARKLNLYPGVSTILRVLHKEALVNWMVEQAVLAVLTTPRIDKETDDAFTKRVLSTERVQDQEMQAARDRGSEMHDSIELLAKGEPVSKDILPWIEPAFIEATKGMKIVGTEVTFAGPGYGGRIDLIASREKELWILDWKTTKKLPDKGAWKDHKLQLSAYAFATQRQILKQEKAVARIRTGNVYISTVEQGKFVICEHEDTPEDNWIITYDRGFFPLLTHWRWTNNYYPKTNQE